LIQFNKADTDFCSFNFTCVLHPAYWSRSR